MQTEITKIQKTKQGRYALFCVTGFLFSVDGDTLLLNHVQEGASFSETEMAKLKRASDFSKAKTKALQYISLRDYGTAELQAKLERTFDKDTAKQAVQKVQELGLIDDTRFAAHRAKYLIEEKKCSVRETQQKLTQLKLNKEIIAEAMQPFLFDEPDSANAVNLVNKKYIRHLQNGEIKKVYAALQRKGFSYRDAKLAVTTVLQEQNIGTDDFSEDFE